MAKNNARVKVLREEAQAEEKLEFNKDGFLKDENVDPSGAPPGAASQPQAPMAEPSMADFCRMPVMLLGGAICGGAGVTPLQQDEIDRLSNALAAVLTVNGVTIKDPRIATAIILGGVVAQVSYPRVVEYRAKVAAAREAVRAANEKTGEAPVAQAA